MTPGFEGRVRSLMEDYGSEACTRWEVRVGGVLFGTWVTEDGARSQASKLWRDPLPVTVIEVTERRLDLFGATDV